MIGYQGNSTPSVPRGLAAHWESGILLVGKGVSIMSTVKTAVSIQRPLFEQTEALAREMGISRSRLVALALEAFIRRHQSRQFLDALNAAYDEDALDPDEKAFLDAALVAQVEIVDEW